MKKFRVLDLILRILIIGPTWVGGFYIMNKATGDTDPWYVSLITIALILTITSIIDIYKKKPVKKESKKTIFFGNIFLLLFFPVVTLLRHGELLYGIAASAVFVIGINLYNYLRVKLFDLRMK
jgi:hypothetical protein